MRRPQVKAFLLTLLSFCCFAGSLRADLLLSSQEHISLEDDELIRDFSLSADPGDPLPVFGHLKNIEGNLIIIKEQTIMFTHTLLLLFFLVFIGEERLTLPYFGCARRITKIGILSDS